MKLIVGTGSTWSLRAWICLQIVGESSETVVIDLTEPGYRAKVKQHSPTGLVPALVTQDITINDSLAICEYLNENSGGRLYPEDTSSRAIARSLCAELHSGFMALRSNCSFTLTDNSVIPERTQALNDEIARVRAIFSNAQLPFMFEQESMVDAFYSILAYRLSSYDITLEGKAGEYQRALLNWPRLVQAIDAAKTWQDGE